MARKNVLRYKLAAAQSLAADFITEPTLIKYLDNCSYQINITTTDSTGTFIIEVSDDYNIEEPTNAVENPGTWAPLMISGTPTVAAADDIITVYINQMPFNAMRVRYDAGTPGTGVCDIWVTAKQIGG